MRGAFLRSLDSAQVPSFLLQPTEPLSPADPAQQAWKARQAAKSRPEMLDGAVRIADNHA
jgi:hypothetical protein